MPKTKVIHKSYVISLSGITDTHTVASTIATIAMAAMKMVEFALLIALICWCTATQGHADDTCFRTWTLEKIENGAKKCVCGDLLGGVVKCDTDSLEVQVLQSYCMTYSDTLNTTVGHCSLTLLHTYMSLDNINTSELNSVMCGGFHRQGQMCGRCEEGYAPPVYSYDLSCVECSDYKYNWLKYIAIALLPLTLFYVLVLIFRISALSGKLDVFVLICQLMSAPGMMRLYGANLSSMPAAIRLISQITISTYGIWNLDFFRTVYTPFCLHPKLTTLQVLILDYVVAVYPLLLICVTYVGVYLHDNYHAVVLLWGPFYRCFARIRREWHIRKSLVDVFATFLLLSFLKIFNVSVCLLAPTALYNVHGQKLQDYVLYFDGTVRYFGKDHIPYVILAIIMLLVFNVAPIIILCLYPCRSIQHCLNHCPCRLQALHTFIDAFQGSFKTAPYDCRCFAALFLIIRIVNLVGQVALQNSFYFPFTSAVLFTVTLVVSFVKPRSYYWHNLIDLVLLALMTFGSCLFFIAIASFLSIAPYIDSFSGYHRFILSGILASFPLVYFLLLLIYSLTPKGVLSWCRNRYSTITGFRFCRVKKVEVVDQNEQTSLLNVM